MSHNDGLEPKLSAVRHPNRSLEPPGGPNAHNQEHSVVPRALVNRGDDPYPVDVKSEAVALVYETGNFSEAARRMAERYPDRHPSRQLVTRWFRQTDPDAFASLSRERKAAFETGVIELADKARGKLYAALDDMTPTQVPVPAGIAMDKGLRLLEIAKRQGDGGDRPVGPVVIVVNADRPQVVDAEVVEAPVEGEAQEVADDADSGPLVPR